MNPKLVGLWASDSSGSSFDDFEAKDAAGPYEVDGRGFTNRGEARIDASENNLLETFGDDIAARTLVRRGFRGDKFVLTYRFKWDTGMRKPGVLVRWVSPGDWLAVQINSSDQLARPMRRKDDDSVTTLKTSGTALSLSAAMWYTGKVVVDDDPNDAALQRLRFWVDTDDDGDYGDETVLLTSTQVDDDWSGGYVGLFRGNQDTNTHQFDDFKVGYDNNADGDFDDGGDVLAIDDNFGDNVTNGAISLSYDANGNLTGDGIFAYAYDAWNRLRLAKLVVGADETTIGDYEYYGDNRRGRKTVTNHGPEVVTNDGGGTVVRFVYAGWNPSGDTMSRWSIVETRDGSSQTTFQHLWGTRYIDELVWIERNGDPAIGDDTDPDIEATDEGSENPPDLRYVAHQDRNWDLRAITLRAPSGSQSGLLAARFTAPPFGDNTLVVGGPSGSAPGVIRPLSSSGVLPLHKGLVFDSETFNYQNRYRVYDPALHAYVQPDPLRYRQGLNAHIYLRAAPLSWVDPFGLTSFDPRTVVDCRTGFASGCPLRVRRIRTDETWPPIVDPFPPIDPFPDPDPDPDPDPTPDPHPDPPDDSTRRAREVTNQSLT
jgi:RHS repeat-associated protein